MLKGTFLGTKWYRMMGQYHVVQYERTVPRRCSMMVLVLYDYTVAVLHHSYIIKKFKCPCNIIPLHYHANPFLTSKHGILEKIFQRW